MKHGTLTMVAMAGTVAIAGAAQAAECPEGFPSGPINLQVGFGAGGGTDAIARSIATAMKEQQDWTIVVENQPGAGGGVTATSLMNADPDGQAIGVAETDTVAIGPYLGDDAQFAWQDFDYLGSAMQLRPVTLPDAPYDNTREGAGPGHDLHRRHQPGGPGQAAG